MVPTLSRNCCAASAAAGELTIADKPKQKIAPPRETTNRSIGLS